MSRSVDHKIEDEMKNDTNNKEASSTYTRMHLPADLGEDKSTVDIIT